MEFSETLFKARLSSDGDRFSSLVIRIDEAVAGFYLEGFLKSFG